MAVYYELIEHTADIGIVLKAACLKKLFENAAEALFEISATRHEGKPRRGTRKVPIQISARDREQLFIDWLNELVSLAASKEWIFTRFSVTRLTENSLEASCIAEERAHFTMLTEIKAATYCDLEIKKIPSGWQAKVIFDV